MRIEQKFQNQSPDIKALAEIAGMSVKEYKKMQEATEQIALDEQLRKEDVADARVKEREERGRQNLINETQTFDRRAMTRSGGFKRIKAGGRTRIAA